MKKKAILLTFAVFAFSSFTFFSFTLYFNEIKCEFTNYS